MILARLRKYWAGCGAESLSGNRDLSFSAARACRSGAGQSPSGSGAYRRPRPAAPAAPPVNSPGPTAARPGSQKGKLVPLPSREGCSGSVPGLPRWPLSLKTRRHGLLLRSHGWSGQAGAAHVRRARAHAGALGRLCRLPRRPTRRPRLPRPPRTARQALTACHPLMPWIYEHPIPANKKIGASRSPPRHPGGPPAGRPPAARLTCWPTSPRPGTGRTSLRQAGTRAPRCRESPCSSRTAP